MAKVTGLGGAFLRADNPEALYSWYEKHLGISVSDGCFMFPSSAQRGRIVVAFFPRSSEYFPTSQLAMLNFQVDDLDGTIRTLQAKGIKITDGPTTTTSGSRFIFIDAPDGYEIELIERKPGTAIV